MSEVLVRYSNASTGRAARVAGAATKLRTLLNLRRIEEIFDDSVWSALSENAVRRTLKTHTSLFSEGDPATTIFLIESGKLLVRRRRRQAARPTMRLLSCGDLFTYDCGGVRAATCVALSDAVLLQIDSRNLREAAQASPLLDRVLRAVHAAELRMILESLGAGASASLAVLQTLPRSGAAKRPALDPAHSAVILRPRFGG